MVGQLSCRHRLTLYRKVIMLASLYLTRALWMGIGQRKEQMDGIPSIG